jgi:chemotaxis protein CheZ
MSILKELSTNFHKMKIEQDSNIYNIDDIVNILLATLEQYATDKEDHDFLSSLKNVFYNFHKYKEELNKLCIENVDKQFENVFLELENINKSSEVSTNNILEITENILTLTKSDLTSESKDNINQNLFKIIESCSFQDLNGQRIQKILKLMPIINLLISAMPLLYNLTPIKVDNEKKLLNGPQLDEDTPDQQDIDNLFNNL